MSWVYALAAICWVPLFLVGIPMLMLRSRWFSVIVPVAYGIFAMFQFWESTATQNLLMVAVLIMFNTVPCLAFYVLQVEPGELVMVPVMLTSLGIAIAFAGTSSDLGCSAPAAYSSNISFICGNLLWWGYVYMFVVLTLVPILFMLRLKGAASWGSGTRTYTRLIIFGFCCSTLTGVFPWLADPYECKDQIQILFIHLPSCSAFNDVLHQGGFSAGIMICSIGSVLLCRSVLQPHMKELDSTIEMSSKRSYLELNFVINLMIVLILLLVCLFIEFGILFSLREQLSEPRLCTLYDTASSCKGGLVPKEVFKSIRDSSTGWPCVWNATQPRSPLAHQCTDPTCHDADRLSQNSAAVACEYFVICCWLYIATFALLLCEEAEKLFGTNKLLDRGTYGQIVAKEPP